MPTSSATQAARAWLSSKNPPPQRVSEVARALALLSGDVPPTPGALTTAPLGPDVEMALVVEAAGRNRYDLVQLVSEHGTTKPAIKHAKKLLFIARQKGVNIPELPKTTRAPVDLSTRPEPLPSYASTLDASGAQMILLGGWSATEGAYCVLAMLSDQEGLVSAYYLPDTSRTQQRLMLGKLRDQFSGLTVEVSPDFAAGRIRWALDVRDTLALQVEGDLPAVRRAVAQADPIQASDVAFELDEDEETRVEQRMVEAASLADEPCFGGWFGLQGADKASFLAEAGSLMGVEDVAERREKLVQARAEHVQRHFHQTLRERMAERLEMTAYLLVLAQKREVALRALATARGLRDPSRPLLSLGFPAAAIDRLLPIDAYLHLQPAPARASTP